MKKLVLVLIAIVLATGISLAKGNNKYFVTTPHTKEECMKAIDDFNGKGGKILSKTEWGCMEGDHTAYCFIEAKSVDDAKKQLPESVRKNAKVVKVTKLTPKMIADMHKGH